MLSKLLTVIVGGVVSLIIIGIVAFIGTLFIYAGWNWGIVPAIPSLAHVVELGTAFWLSLGLASIGSRFQSKLTPES